MRYVIGIDAGGAKTVGLLADESGHVQAEARATGANLHIHGVTGVEQVVREILDELRPPSPVAAICLGGAGVGRGDDKDSVYGIFRRLGSDAALCVVNDADIALVAGAGRRTGIVLVAGTGSIAYGVDPGGRQARSGGWGYLLADEGSAFWLGQAALRRIVSAADGRGPATDLADRVAERLGVKVPAGLVSWAYGAESPRYRFAELAPLVTQAAAAGDAVAVNLLEQAARHLAGTARSVARRLQFPDPFPLVLSGGVVRGSALLSCRIEEILDLPLARIAVLDVEPAMGAVRLALDLLRDKG